MKTSLGRLTSVWGRITWFYKKLIGEWNMWLHSKTLKSKISLSLSLSLSLKNSIHNPKEWQVKTSPLFRIRCDLIFLLCLIWINGPIWQFYAQPLFKKLVTVNVKIWCNQQPHRTHEISTSKRLAPSQLSKTYLSMAWSSSKV